MLIPAFIYSMQREVVEDLKRELNGLEQQHRSARSHAEACKQAKVRHERREKDLQIAMQRMEDQAEALRDALDKENVEEGQIDSLRAALQEAEDERKLNEGSFNDSRDATNSMAQSLKLIRRELSEKDAGIATLKEKLRDAESEQEVVADRRRKILSDKNAAIARIAEDKQDRARVHEKRDQVAERVLAYQQKANRVSRRVPVDEGETTASLDRKLTRLHEDIERYTRE